MIDDTKKRIAIFSIFTGNYSVFYKQFVKSIAFDFLPEHDKHFFICTDKELSDYKCVRGKVTQYVIDDLPWPLNTLKRFEYYNDLIKNDTQDFDYVFFLNSNARCANQITANDINLENDFTFVLHDNHLIESVEEKPFERNLISSACFLSSWNNPQYIGARFFGAKPSKFAEMCLLLKENINKDLENDIIAKWHDESHLNYYYNTHKETLSHNLLSVNYHVQEQHADRDCFTDKKMWYVDKNKKTYKHLTFKKYLTDSDDTNLAILVWKFPTQANTYIVAEMLELLKYEKNFIIYSIDEPSDTTKKMFENELHLLRDKIVYVNSQKLLSYPRGISKIVAFDENKKRRDLLKSKDSDHIEKEEQKSLEASYPIVEKLALHMQANNIKHIYSPFGNGTTEYALFINYTTKIPYSFAVHAYDIFVNYYYVKAKSESVTNVFSITEYNKKYLIENCKMSESKIHIKRINFLEHNYEDVESIQETSPFIFSAGRIEEMKGFEYSIKGFHHCLSKYPNLKYYIAGRAIRGEYDTKIENLINELNLKDKVIMLGSIENNRVYSYAKDAIFCVLTSIHESNGDTEGMPTFFAESMRMSTPCVGSNISGIPETVESGITGELVNESDQASINEKMEKMLNVYFNDNELYKKMQIACKTKVTELYDNEKNIKILIDNIKTSIDVNKIPTEILEHNKVT